MKKFIAIIMVVLAVILFGGLTAPSANAAEVTKVTNVTGVTGEINVTGVAIAAPGTSISTAVAPPTKVNTPLWLYVSCYWAMDGARYCWRYACTFYERVVMGCYNGWYRTTIWYA